MSKRRSEINLSSGFRLSEWLQEVNITQKELANRIYYTQQQISKIVNGKAALSPQLAEEISEATPKPIYNEQGDIIGYEYVRASFLLGLDDFKTQAEQSRAIYQEARLESDCMFTGLSLLAKLSGYVIEPPQLNGIHDAEAAIAAVKAGYFIEKDGASITLSLEEMNALENNVVNMVEAQLDFLFKLKGGSQNG